MDIHRGSGPLRSGPTGPGSGFSVMPSHVQKISQTPQTVFELTHTLSKSVFN